MTLIHAHIAKLLADERLIELRRQSAAARCGPSTRSPHERPPTQALRTLRRRRAQLPIIARGFAQLDD
jgi:hypothetical protein